MRREVAILILLFIKCAFTANAQYEDTLKGKIDIEYNHPRYFKVSLLGGLALETSTMDGGGMFPQAFAEAHIRPLKQVILHAGIKYQSNFAWTYQNIKDVGGIELGGRLYLSNKVVEKNKLFTAGNKQFNYDFFMPVRVGWSLGLCGDIQMGRATFNSGTDKNTGVKFQREGFSEIKFEKQFGFNYSYQTTSVGFVISTATRLKGIVHLPTGALKARRMKSFTEFKVEYIFGLTNNYDTELIRESNASPIVYTKYKIHVLEKRNSGFRISGFFRRKLLGIKLEAGIKPGIYYRFTGSEKESMVDRSYFNIGIGMGWM